MPEDIGGRPARIVRIGLGALTARQAKLQAEMLAALARNRFEQIRMARMHDSHESRPQDAAFGGDSPEITAAEVKGYLKALHAILSQPAPPTPPHQKPAFDGMKSLVLLNRELEKGAGANPLIAKNVEVLKRESIASINQSLGMLGEIDVKPAEDDTSFHVSGKHGCCNPGETVGQPLGAAASRGQDMPPVAPKLHPLPSSDDGGPEMSRRDDDDEQPELALSIEMVSIGAQS